MLLIANLSKEITDAVNEFWSDISISLETSLLDINADELMAIFLYLIFKSKFPQIIYHLNLIREFTTTITRNSVVGYYFVTLDASIMYINSLNDRADLIEAKDRSSLSMNNSKINFGNNIEGLDE